MENWCHNLWAAFLQMEQYLENYRMGVAADLLTLVLLIFTWIVMLKTRRWK